MCLLTGKILYDVATDPSAAVIAVEDTERTIVEFWQTPGEVSQMEIALRIRAVTHFSQLWFGRDVLYSAERAAR
jgi:hypothetical protein